MSYTDKLNPSSGKYIGPEDVANTAEIMRVSTEITLTATSISPVTALTIPLGALVTKVGLLFTENVAGAGPDDIEFEDIEKTISSNRDSRLKGFPLS